MVTPTASEANEAPMEAGELSQLPGAQLLRILLSLGLTGAAAAAYGHVLLSFWSSPSLGIHLRIPYPAYLWIAIAFVLGLAGLRIGLGIQAPHAKLGVSILAFLICAVVGFGGGRFVKYSMSGTRNPPFKLNVKVGDRFPDFALPDQSGHVHRFAPDSSRATLIAIYRGDFCPFARYELSELTATHPAFDSAGVNVIAISTGPIERSALLARYLGANIPLLSDERETLLNPLGLVEHHRDREPDNAIPAFFIVDRDGIVRWIFTSPYYRELPEPKALLQASSETR